MTRSTLLAIFVSFGVGGSLPAQDAADTLKRIGVTKGICVVVGAPDGALALELARSSELVVHVQLPGAEQAAALRREAEQAGLLGSRLYVEHLSSDRIPLADNVADAVVAVGKANRREVMRVLQPGGKALLGGETETKAFPEGADDWSHPYHGPDNNPQSNDTLARGPFMTQFMSEPWYSAMHHFSVFSGGRVFKVMGNRTSTQAHWASLNTLMALNAFNGTKLWERKLPEHFMTHRSTIIATPDLLYFADDTSCKRLDARTGVVRDEIVAPADADGPVWKWIALKGGVLYALVGGAEPKVQNVRGTRFRGAGWPWWRIEKYRFGYGRTLLAIDPESRKILWRHDEPEEIDSRALCMSGGKIYLYSDGKYLAALDEKTGKQVWKSTDKAALDAIGKHDPAQIWWKGFASTSYAKCSEKAIYFAGPTRTRLVAVSAENGKLLWDREGGNHQLVIRPEAVYALGHPKTTKKGEQPSFKLDPMTGEVLANFGARVSCTRATANADSIFVRGGRGGSTTVFDIRSAQPKQGLITPMRPACQDGVIVANGNLYWGPWICRCDSTQIGVISLSPGGDHEFGTSAVESERLRTSSGAATTELAVDDRDWPTYRKDNVRSGRTAVSIPTGASPGWTFTPAQKNVATSPVVVGDLAIVAGSDGAVRALDTKTGQPRWTAYTGGWVKISPTIAEGQVFVGSGDGRVYCLDAGTGATRWTFRAAPAERKIPIYGSLFSTWPVGSGVLVADGVAYAAAGIENYDGTHVYALEAKTGKIKWQNNEAGHRVGQAPDSGVSVQGSFLMHDGSLYMCGGSYVNVARFDPSNGKFSRVGKTERTRLLGKDLYVIGDEVRTTGYPLYWRQMDSHHVTTYRTPVEGKHFLVFGDRVGLAEASMKSTQRSGDRRGAVPQWVWNKPLFTEYSSVTVAANAVVVAGVDWKGEGPGAVATGGIAAVDPKDGKILWKHVLPSPPVMFGAVVDRHGRILVGLRDGRVVSFK